VNYERYAEGIENRFVNKIKKKYNKTEGNKNPAILSTWPVKANWNTQ